MSGLPEIHQIGEGLNNATPYHSEKRVYGGKPSTDHLHYPPYDQGTRNLRRSSTLVQRFIDLYSNLTPSQKLYMGIAAASFTTAVVGVMGFSASSMLGLDKLREVTSYTIAVGGTGTVVGLAMSSLRSS